ncbi:MAG: oligosaccharide flippase family protein [Planctomycetota bacterium]|nr:oligosaccharide flippase family protein [Planctomycetota bacterium]
MATLPHSPPGASGESGAAQDRSARVTPAAPPSLRSRIFAASTWTVLGIGFSRGLSMVNNLILTRLLFPEAFGLMTLVTVVTLGVQLFSDIGLRAAVLTHERGDDPDFLDTTWVLQIVRGAALWLLISLLAWPAATFYEEPLLRWMLPLAGLSSLINGFGSTAGYTLARRVTPQRAIVLGLGVQLVTLALTAAAALIWRSVWVLVGASVLAAILGTIGSYWLIPERKHRFEINREHARSIYRFGRWILFSTAIMFFLSQGDRLVLGKLLTKEMLGVYSVAFVLNETALQLAGKLSFNVLHPVFSEIRTDPGPALRRRIFKLRGTILVLVLPVAWLLAILGDDLVALLYDERYVEAGWMVRILALGAVGRLVAITSDRQLLAAGDSLGYLGLQVARVVLLAACAFLGYRWGDFRGLLFGIAAARTLEYVPLAPLLRRHGGWLPGLDAAAFLTSAAVISAGFYAFGAP